MMKAILLHLGHNLWCDWYPEGVGLPDGCPSVGVPDVKLRCKAELFRRCCDHAVSRGLDTVVIDLAEGFRYPSHPELAIEGSWSAERMAEEIAHLKSVGMRAVPKLNFSTTHNGWLKHYRHMVSSAGYYAVQRDLIRDVWEVFGKPELLHIGMDEEYVNRQVNSKRYGLIVVRSPQLYREDFIRTVGEVEKLGMRAWSWADYAIRNPDFVDWCPKSVLLSSYYYDEDGAGFDTDKMTEREAKPLKTVELIDSRGFEQVPCVSNWVGSGRRKKGMDSADDAIAGTIGFCRRRVSPKRLKGFVYAPWAHCTREEKVEFINRGTDLFAACFRKG